MSQDLVGAHPSLPCEGCYKNVLLLLLYCRMLLDWTLPISIIVCLDCKTGTGVQNSNFNSNLLELGII